MNIPMPSTRITLLAPKDLPTGGDTEDDWGTAPDPSTGYEPVETGIRAHFSATGQGAFGFGQYTSEGNVEQLRFELLADPCGLAPQMRVLDETTELTYDVAWVIPKPAPLSHVVAGVTRSVGTP